MFTFDHLEPSGDEVRVIMFTLDHLIQNIGNVDEKVR